MTFGKQSIQTANNDSDIEDDRAISEFTDDID